jgi:hypothetical protein
MKVYRGCTFTREHGYPRYFGHPHYPVVKTQYRVRWWKVHFPDSTWCLCGTLSEAREYVDRVGYRHKG